MCVRYSETRWRLPACSWCSPALRVLRPACRPGAVDARAISKVLPIPLWPDEVVAVFLAHPRDDAKGRLAHVDEKAGTYDVAFEPEGGGAFDVIVRAKDDAIVAWHQYKRD